MLSYSIVSFFVLCTEVNSYLEIKYFHNMDETLWKREEIWLSD